MRMDKSLERISSSAADLQLLQATREDMPRVIELYEKSIAALAGKPEDPQWNLENHPSIASLTANAEAGCLLIGTLPDCDELAAAMVLNADFAAGYDTVAWHVSASPGEALCVHTFCTNPDLSRRGIGKRFLQLAADHARSLGAKALRLDVLVQNAPAQALYEKAGYENLGFCTLNYGDPKFTDFYMYELAL